YASLRKDPVTAEMIAEITALKRGVAATPLALPSGCRAAATPRVGFEAPSGTALPEGVFRGKRTAADIPPVLPNADAGERRPNEATVTFTFRNGTFGIVLSDGGLPRCRRGEGTYSINGHFVTTRILNVHGCPGVAVPGPPLTMRWWYDDNKLR